MEEVDTADCKQPLLVASSSNCSEKDYVPKADMVHMQSTVYFPAITQQ
jgi:hypothetical protein